jgi:hypothetical protein
MSYVRPMPYVLIAAAVAATAIAAVPARAADSASVDPARSEVSVFGGISILDARRSQQSTITVPDIPGFPGFPGLPGWSGSTGGTIQINTETRLENSVLFGARYAFYLRKQLAIEADFAVAPSHDLRGGVDVCGPAGRCFGQGDYQQAGMASDFVGAMNGFFGGPMGGRFRGMDGMYGGHGGEGWYGGRSVTAWHYGAGLTYDILGGDVRPFLVLGAGGVSYDGTSGAKTDFVLRFGAGLKVYFGRLGARVDAVDHLVFNQFLSGHDEHDVHITGGALVRF